MNEVNRKRPFALGKLNRLTAKATPILISLGHSDKRFKRFYFGGTATYTCPKCNLTAEAFASPLRGESKLSGEAMVTPCAGVKNENT